MSIYDEQLSQVQARMSELRAQIEARPDGTPNLRDYYGKPTTPDGLDDFDQFRRAVAEYGRETGLMKARIEVLASERNALRARVCRVCGGDNANGEHDTAVHLGSN